MSINKMALDELKDAFECEVYSNRKYAFRFAKAQFKFSQMIKSGSFGSDFILRSISRKSRRIERSCALSLFSLGAGG